MSQPRPLPSSLPPAPAADAADRLALLARRLAAADSATRLLQDWCEAHGIGSGPVRAVRMGRAAAPAPPDLLAALAAPPEATLRHRRVQLVRGQVVLSDCQVWWPAGALSPAMEAALAGTDTPFGLVIAPLSPRRRTLEVSTHPDGEAHVLHLAALVLAANGAGPPRPLAAVEERYRRVLVEPLPAQRPA